MELVLNKKKEITIKDGDKESKILITVPTMAIQKNLQEELEAAQKAGESPFNAMLKWANLIGLPESVIQALSMDDFLEFVEWISGSKKKQAP
jgi:hypothetical protein